MRALLTSAGITNPTIARALSELVGKPVQDIKVGFIPIAANVEEGNKDWFISQLTNLQAHGYKWIDIIDPSASDIDWRKRLSKIDVVLVSGGNTFHLLNQYRKTGFDFWLKDNLQSIVYVGISAGSIIAAPVIDVCTIKPSDPNLPGLVDLTGLNIVDFEIEPHCDENRFLVIEKYAKNRNNKVYAIDDETAVKIDVNGEQIVSEGKWKEYKPFSSHL